MFKYIVFLSLVLSVVLTISSPVFAEDEQKEYMNVCRMDENRDGIVNIADFNSMRQRMQNWPQEKRELYMSLFRQAFGKTCERNVDE